MKPASTSAQESRPLIHHQYAQCQHCWKSKGNPGVSLMKCSRCRVTLYCSRQCQREAWPTHKARCVKYQETNAAISTNDEVVQLNEEMTKWTHKHRPLLSQTVLDGLDLRARPEARETHVLLLTLSRQPSSPSIQKRFHVDSAIPLTFNQLAPIVPDFFLDDLQTQRKVLDDDMNRIGFIGVAIILLTCKSHMELHRIVPICFGQDNERRNEKWLEKLQTNARTGTTY